jgi:hypothetical protein
MVKFAEYSGSTTLNDLGTLKSIVGKGGSVKLSMKNFTNENKRVVVIANKANGESAVIACSDGVSKHARSLRKEGKKQAEVLGWLIGLNVLENEKEQYFISMPSGTPGEGISVDKLKVLDTKEVITNTEELIAW